MKKQKACIKNKIYTEHLLLGLIEEEGGVAGRALRDLGLEPDRVREMVERLSGYGRGEEKNIELSVGTQQVLNLAILEARNLGHQYIGTEHLLLGLVQSSEDLALEVMKKLGITPEQVRRQTRRVMQESTNLPAPAGGVTPSTRREEKKETKTPLVDQLATDLTTLAEEGKLDPVIGRQKEIERLIQILARRNKNNPALIGEPGVGKPPSWKGWQKESSKAMCLHRSLESVCYSWMSDHWWQARCTAVNLKSGSSG